MGSTSATSSAAGAEQKKLPRRAALVSFVGSMLEYYDFFIYGTAAALIFPKVFFANVDPATGTLLALLSFGIGYIARPVGAIILGHFGDRIGRKTVLLFTLVLMGGSTLAIGLLPDAKTIGTIYNASESNSVVINKLAKAEAAKRGLGWVEVQVASSAEVKAAIESLVGRVDTLLMPQDNTVASAFDAVVKVARGNKLPLFSLDTSTVERGAIASYAQDQYQTGLDWATDVAVPILLGRNPGTIVPVRYRAWDLYVNTAAASAMNVTVPPALVQKAKKVFDK